MRAFEQTDINDRPTAGDNAVGEYVHVPNFTVETGSYANVEFVSFADPGNGNFALSQASLDNYGLVRGQVGAEIV